MLAIGVWLALLAPADLAAQMDVVARTAHGHVGAAVMVLETGQSAGIHRGDRFPMQSVYKLPIAMTVLAEVDRGTLALDQMVRVEARELVPAPVHSPLREQREGHGFEITLRDLLRFAVEESDGSASDVLLRLAGGPARVTAYVKNLGVTGLVVATSELDMAASEDVQYRNYASPNAAIDLLRAVQAGRGLSPASQALLRRFLAETQTGLKRIKALLPPGTIVAHKTGTSGTYNGLTRATNDVGIVTLPDGTHLGIAVFVADSTASDDVREAVIAHIARAAWDHWTTKPR